MELIADKNGVDIMIAPVEDHNGLHMNVDFNWAKVALFEMDHVAREWDIQMFDEHRVVGRACFKAFQFFAEGVERRTVSLSLIELEPRYRGQGRSYDVAKHVLERVQIECDREWGPVYGSAVLFIEKKDLEHVPEHQRQGLFSFLKKVGEKILGVEPKHQPPPFHDSIVTVIGDNISLQLIEGHLLRSNPAR